jgi:hypothetical protein
LTIFQTLGDFKSDTLCVLKKTVGVCAIYKCIGRSPHGCLMLKALNFDILFLKSVSGQYTRKEGS